MWRPWSKPITLALADDSAALRLADASTRLLVEPGGGLATHAALLPQLATLTSVLAGQSVRVILSNHYVRYSVLPWQDAVCRRADWLALAAHDLRQRYGAVADQWQVRVHLAGYGQPVLSTAIDRALQQGLQHMAQEQGWRITAIEPLLNPLLKRISAQPSNAPHWLLMAEPGRVVLGELQQGRYQAFSVISPTQGQEQDSARQLLSRTLLRHPPEQQPAQVLAAIAPQLGGWSDVHDLLRPLPHIQANGGQADGVQPDGFKAGGHAQHAEWLAAI